MKQKAKKPRGQGRVPARPGRAGAKGKAAVPRGKGAVLAAPGGEGANRKEPVPAAAGRAGAMSRPGRVGEKASDRAGEKTLMVVGSVALDSVKTPFGQVQEVLGGSAAFFATAASYFTPVNVIAVVGEDFPEEHLTFLRKRNIDLSGVERRPGKTFRWQGEYSYQLNEAKTLDTQLNVFESFRPQVPESHRSPGMLFLANIDPDLQRSVLEQVKRPRLVACDTMNFWIDGKRDALIRLLKDVDVLLINDGEARALGQHPNLVAVARTILAAGPKTLIIKRGEYGVVMFTGDRVFAVPAFPLEAVKDPTGAGDCFAGGFMGYLASSGNVSEHALRRAVVYGSVMASFAVEAFSLDRLRVLDYTDIEARFRAFKQMTIFEEL